MTWERIEIEDYTNIDVYREAMLSEDQTEQNQGPQSNWQYTACA